MASLLQAPNLRAQATVARDMRSSMRLHFLYAAIECGLLQALSRPSSKEHLLERLDVRRLELLEALLDAGVSLKELSLDRGLYRIRGRISQALVTSQGDPLAALIQEHVYYHSSVYRHFAQRLKGGPLGDYLEETGTMVARSSRVLEPMVASFARRMVRSVGPLRLLEIGCGSGVYLRQAFTANREISGVAIDMRKEVVDEAIQNLTEWGIGDRFRVLVGDIRHPSAELDGPFDVITLYNNIYYFDPAGYASLFGSLRSRLAKGGTLGIVSMMKGKSLTSLQFDIVLRSTTGCARLPTVSELCAILREAGFAHVASEKLMPGEPLYGIAAN
ncbi:MAG: class I SAM-dependent methyltransferase [Dehalococcoidia bacterium]|nr:class I SAM-dependent methyltransferase [Dehalococcoidia bacterium]